LRLASVPFVLVVSHAARNEYITSKITRVLLLIRI
jgi:hypothetical protein